jgi:queuine tRNA-ribosyltransferase
VTDGCYKLEACNDSARAGHLIARDGTVLPTPLFQPVATAGSLKTLDWGDVRALGYQHVLMNTYHLVVRPGLELIREAGGVKPFTGWSGSVLTDSGGYQAYSLAQRRKVDVEGITFQDHIAGDMHRFTPRSVLEAQLAFGVDFAMCLDVCTGQDENTAREQTARDMALTHAWAREQTELWPALLERGSTDPLTSPQADGQDAALKSRAPQILGIVQGGLDEDLRAESIEFISGLGFDGIAVGGLAVGEPREELERLVSFCGAKLPSDQPRYLMGIGDPADLLFAIAHGFDMFDCVQPTRMARHGVAYTWQGKLPLRQERFKQDLRGLNGARLYRAASSEAAEGAGLKTRAPEEYSRAYLRHLFTLKEHSYARLLTLHNLAFYAELMAEARRRIVDGSYQQWWPGVYEQVDRVLPDGL